MTKKQINIRASSETRRKIEQLADAFGTTKTEVMALAVDRLYTATFPHRCEKCGTPLGTEVAPHWVDESQSVWLCDECV